MTREELLKIAKPILFNTEMVQAILEGRKTVTRRVVKPQPTYSPRDGFTWKGGAYGTDLPPTIQGAAYNFLCAAPFKKGDYLYVRETWSDPTPDQSGYPILYMADMPMRWEEDDVTLKAEDYKWKPSIHMPKEAARLFLKVTDVRVERLQDMSEDDAFAEGVSPWDDRCYERNGWEPTFYDPDSGGSCQPLYAFEDIWNSTIKKADLDKYGWEANPWVWVIEFERVEV